MGLVGRVIQAAGWAIAGVLALGIALVLTDANEDNALVDLALGMGRFLAEPFRRIFVMDDNDVQIAVNWGIAAIAYVAAAIALSALVHAVARRASARPGRSAASG